MLKFNTKNLILISFLAALTGILSQIALPLPFTPVPVNLATLGVCLSGVLLGSKNGALSQIVYILLGILGIPVFSNFSSGIGILVGPTGGYILGYVVAAFAIGLLTKQGLTKMPNYLISMTLGIILCYILGTIWFMIITKNTLYQSLIMCVLPFIPGDILKIVLASLLSVKLRPKLI